jgi:hypothetical protein
MNSKPYWMTMKSGQPVASDEARKPVTDEKRAEAEAALEALAKRIRDSKDAS